jgi:hypothetical protein
MNKHLLNKFTIIACSVLFVAGCGDQSALETPNTSGTPTNNGLISQNNFTILFAPTDPKYVDLASNTFTAVTAKVSVQIGDINNQLITGGHTIYFRTQWGLIDPSCVTVNGTCSVTWRSGSPDDMPDNYRNRIVAYSNYDSGQESYIDLDGNGSFNDGETFTDVDEPFININGNYTIDGNPYYDAGDIIIDTVNGLDPTGKNGMHDAGDTLFNGPKCTDTVLCSTMTTVTVWESGALQLTGSDQFSVGGTISGLTGTVILQNNSGDDLSVAADGDFTFATSLYPGTTYEVTVKTQPAGQTCTPDTVGAPPVSTAKGTVNGDVTSVSITCTTP